MADICYYILVYNHTDGMALHEELRGQGLAVRVSPAPRAAKTSCGMSILVDKKDIEVVRRVVEHSAIPIDRIVDLENQIDPNRDRYC